MPCAISCPTCRPRLAARPLLGHDDARLQKSGDGRDDGVESRGGSAAPTIARSAPPIAGPAVWATPDSGPSRHWRREATPAARFVAGEVAPRNPEQGEHSEHQVIAANDQKSSAPARTKTGTIASTTARPIVVTTKPAAVASDPSMRRPRDREQVRTTLRAFRMPTCPGVAPTPSRSRPGRRPRRWGTEGTQRRRGPKKANAGGGGSRAAALPTVSPRSMASAYPRRRRDRPRGSPRGVSARADAELFDRPAVARSRPDLCGTGWGRRRRIRSADR